MKFAIVCLAAIAASVDASVFSTIHEFQAAHAFLPTTRDQARHAKYSPKYKAFKTTDNH